MKLLKIFALAGVAGALALVVAAEHPGKAHSAAPESLSGVTVIGSGTVKAAPDQAHFSFAVSTNAATSSAALSSNAAKMRTILGALKAAGVASRDIQTDDVSVYMYDGAAGSSSGYTARNSVSVTLHDVKAAGAIVDKATAAGATDVYGPSLGRESRTDLYRTALRKAVADARAKAATLADATGVSLGRVTRVEEGQQVDYGYGPQVMARQAAAPTPIEPGTQDVTATVTVTFAIA